MMRSTIGSRTRRPAKRARTASEGFTATAVSPSIVSGRVVATVTNSPVSAPSSSTTGYFRYQKEPSTSRISTSSSASAVRVTGSQLTSRLPR